MADNPTFDDGLLETMSSMEFDRIENVSLTDMVFKNSSVVSVTLIAEDVGHVGLISDSLKDIFVAVNYAWLAGIASCFGIITNIVNIVVFIRMGLDDAVNISLLGLAVGDIMSLISLLWNSVCFNPVFKDSPIPVAFTEIQYLTGGWPHVCFTRVTSWITAFITFERCLCIALPLKVKNIITTRRAKIVVTAIFLTVVITASPEYYVNQLAWKYYPETNKTLIGLVFTDDREKFERVTFLLNNILLQIVSFFSVILCTVILIVKLNQKTKWRQKSTAADTGASVSTKDKKVIKMVTFISTIFIICYLPSIMLFIAMAAEFDLRPFGQYWNTFHVTWSFAFVLEGLNSSVNIFVYLNMSSRYNAVFKQTFPCMRKFMKASST